MFRKITRCLLALVGCLLLLQSCKPSIPSKYIQPDEMEDILFDYHIADAMARDYGNEDAQKVVAYRAAVLKKYGVTQAEFDSSMVYYTRYTHQLQKIYESLSERIGNESQAADSSTGRIMLGNSASSDTTNIWHGSDTFVLSPYNALSVATFKFSSDTTYHKGDTYLLDFDAQFIYQDGTRDAVVMLAMKLKNDSTVSQVLHLSSTNHYSVQIEDKTMEGVKEVKGFFTLNKGDSKFESETTFKLAIFHNIALVKMHKKDGKPKEKNIDSSRQPQRTDPTNNQRVESAGSASPPH